MRDNNGNWKGSTGQIHVAPHQNLSVGKIRVTCDNASWTNATSTDRPQLAISFLHYSLHFYLTNPRSISITKITEVMNKF